ncbi:Rpp14/Pop5 family domain containing protein [Naviculisporaceae sp. PSN 640]
MVRLKDRYLLVTIIYSDVPTGKGQGQQGYKQNDQQPPVSDLLLFNQPTTNDLKPQLLLKGIRNQVHALFGDCGSGAVDRSLQVKYLNPATSTFILRVSRAYYRLAWAALSFMNKVPVHNGRPCIYRVVRVSGTIRKVEEDAIRRANLLILAAKEEIAGKSSGSGSNSALDALFRGGLGGGGSGKDQTRSLTNVQDQDSDNDVEDDVEDGSELEDAEMSDG